MCDVLLTDCRVVTENEDYLANIAVQDGKISAILAPEETLEAGQTISCAGKIVFPGMIDAHVHFNDPGYTHREEFASGTAAAAAGGLTAVVDMPLCNEPVAIGPAEVETKLEAVSKQAYVDFALWGGIVNNNFDKLKYMQSAGVAAVKGFLVSQGEEFPWLSTGVLYEGMAKCAELDLMIGLHCEDEALVGHRTSIAKRKGDLSVEDFLWCHAPETEIVSVNTAIEIARATGVKLHILHVSLPEAIEKVVQAKSEGVNVTVETCPHYLVLDEDDLREKGAYAKCTPPIRSRDKVEGLWQCLLDGKIDYLGSDHSPSTIEEKEQASFGKSWGGIQGVQYMLPIMLSEGVHKRGMSLNQLAGLLSVNPSKRMGFYPRKGTVRVGAEASFTVVDLDKPWEIDREGIRFKNKHTPYLGMKGKGAPVMTILRGNVVYDGRDVVHQDGRYLNMSR